MFCVKSTPPVMRAFRGSPWFDASVLLLTGYASSNSAVLRVMLLCGEQERGSGHEGH